MLRKHPKGLMVLFFTEMWERFAFYTMLAVFFLFMDEVMGWSDRFKGQVYGFYLAFVYFTPIAGGWIADKFLGYRRTIILGAVVFGTGYALLSLSGPDAVWLFFLALIIIIAGNGMFKANISVLVGNLYEEKSPLKDTGYLIFYMGINVGAFIAPLAATALHEIFDNYNSAFAAASIGMILSLLVFEFGKSRYLHAEKRTEAEEEGAQAAVEGKEESVKLSDKASEKERLLALGIIFAIVIFFWMAFHQNGAALTAFAQRSIKNNATINAEEIQDWSSFKTKIETQDSIIKPYFVENPQGREGKQLNERKTDEVVSTFNEIIFDHQFYNKIEDKIQIESLDSDLRTLIAETDSVRRLEKNLVNTGDLLDIYSINRRLLVSLYPQHIKPSDFHLLKPHTYKNILNPETYATFNPFFILVITPLLVGFWAWLRKRGREPSSPAKIGLGMFISGLSMIIMILASLEGGDLDINIMAPGWLISTYLVITVGELCLSPMGLSFVSKVAPVRMRGLMMGGWFGATAVGNYLSGLLSSFYSDFPHHTFFLILTVFLFVSALLVRLFLGKLKHATRGT